MKYVHFLYREKPAWGRVEGDRIIGITAAPYHEHSETGRVLEAEGMIYLAPAEPSKVIAVGLNYLSHAGQAAPPEPGLFLKLPSSLIGHKQIVHLPEGASEVHYEGEMVAVMGKKASRISEDQACQYVFGVTAGNDVSERVWQKNDLQWVRAKGADGFGPAGPFLVTGLDYNNLKITTRLNGRIVQSESTAGMIHSTDRIISYISRYITLLPGDMIFTGTPGTTGPMGDGDRIEVELEGVGVLANEIRAGAD